MDFRKLFVRNIQINTSNESLRALFEMHGEVIECSINNHTGYVTMKTSDMAREALSSLNGTEFSNKTISIEYWRSKNHRRGRYLSGSVNSRGRSYNRSCGTRSYTHLNQYHLHNHNNHYVEGTYVPSEVQAPSNNGFTEYAFNYGSNQIITDDNNVAIEPILTETCTTASFNVETFNGASFHAQSFNGERMNVVPFNSMAYTAIPFTAVPINAIPYNIFPISYNVESYTTECYNTESFPIDSFNNHVQHAVVYNCTEAMPTETHTTEMRYTEDHTNVSYSFEPYAMCPYILVPNNSNTLNTFSAVTTVGDGFSVGVGVQGVENLQFHDFDGSYIDDGAGDFVSYVDNVQETYVDIVEVCDEVDDNVMAEVEIEGTISVDEVSLGERIYYNINSVLNDGSIASEPNCNENCMSTNTDVDTTPAVSDCGDSANNCINVPSGVNLKYRINESLTINLGLTQNAECQTSDPCIEEEQKVEPKLVEPPNEELGIEIFQKRDVEHLATKPTVVKSNTMNQQLASTAINEIKVNCQNKSKHYRRRPKPRTDNQRHSKSNSTHHQQNIAIPNGCQGNALAQFFINDYSTEFPPLDCKRKQKKKKTFAKDITDKKCNK